MKLKDILNEQDRLSTSRDFGTPEAGLKHDRDEKNRKAGYADGYAGKKAANRDSVYKDNYKAGQEARAHAKKNPTRHTREYDREERAEKRRKAMKEAYESPTLTPAQAHSVRDLISGAGMDLDEGAEEVLYRIFCDANEMPYGVAKARTGDPSEWIYNRLSRMKPAELEQFLNDHTAQ